MPQWLKKLIVFLLPIGVIGFFAWGLPRLGFSDAVIMATDLVIAVGGSNIAAWYIFFK